MKTGLKVSFIGLAVSGLAAASYAVGLVGLPFSSSAPVVHAAERVGYWVEGGEAQPTAAVVAAIRQAGWLPDSSSREAADIVLTVAAAPASTGVLPVSQGAPTGLSSAAVIARKSVPTRYASAYARHAVSKAKLDAIVAALSKPAAADATWTMVAVGDIGFGRSVYQQMLRYKDYLRPFSYFADTLKAADLAVANLETAVSDHHAVVSSSGMTFVSPFVSAQGLKTSGFDAVSLANNHSFNGGAAGFIDTIEEMERLGVVAFGGGRNAAAARSAKILTVKGKKIALLGYSAIVGSQRPGVSTPGMNYISMSPWGPFSETDVQRMEADIRLAKTQADVVIPFYHWGTEYTHDANGDQRAVAHRAIDAGADLILGAHPHWVQGVEWYHDRLITYSLGNFIFDQSWSEKTKQGTMLKTTWSGNRLTGAELVPYQIYDNFQPRPAAPAVSASVLNDVFTHSWWPGR